MKFLTVKDFLTVIKKARLLEIIENDESKLETAEQIAIEEVGSHLSHRYNTASTFAPLLPWDPAAQYSAKDRLLYAVGLNTEEVYTAKENTSAGESPESAAAKWEKGDSRNKLIVTFTVDIALYHLFAGGTPHQIPDLRQNRYDSAISWLRSVAKGNLSTALELIEPEQGSRISWGSGAKRELSY